MSFKTARASYCAVGKDGHIKEGKYMDKSSPEFSPIVVKVNSNTEGLDDTSSSIAKTSVANTQQIEKMPHFNPVMVCEANLELSQNSNSSVDTNFDDHKDFDKHGVEFYEQNGKSIDTDTSHNEKRKCRYRCAICGKEFHRKSGVMSHYETHSRDKEHACCICQRVFKGQKTLRTHCLSHLIQKKHPCPTCGRKFKDKGYLRIHENIHTENRPYICDVCGDAFKDPSARNKHLKIHSGIKPFSCDICDKSFLRKGDLKLHLHFHTAERPHSCSMCDRTFQSTSGYYKHLSRLHNIQYTAKSDVQIDIKEELL